jgi:hypothetical protein
MSSSHNEVTDLPELNLPSYVKKSVNITDSHGVIDVKPSVKSNRVV